MGKKATTRLLIFLISAAILSSCGSASTSPQSITKVQVTSTTNPAVTATVPWIDQPATIPTTTVMTARLPATCKPADLRVGTATFGLATAQEGWRVPIADTRSQPCSLSDYLPVVTAIGPSGNRVTLSNGPLVQPAPPIVFQPDIKINFLILSGAFCDSAGLVQPSENYSSVELGLPTGTLGLSKLSLKLCSDKIFSGFQWPVETPVPPGTVASLSAHLEIPKTVKAGTTLDYLVVLENQSNETVDLNPCPVYKELIYVVNGAKGKTNSQVLQLNCSTVHSIKPHQKVTYQMVIQVPSETGLAKFSWQVEPSGPFAGGGVTIMR